MSKETIDATILGIAFALLVIIVFTAVMAAIRVWLPIAPTCLGTVLRTFVWVWTGTTP